MIVCMHTLQRKGKKGDGGGKALSVLKYREQSKGGRSSIVRDKGGNLAEFFFCGGGWGAVQFTSSRIQRMKNLR